MCSSMSPTWLACMNKTKIWTQFVQNQFRNHKKMTHLSGVFTPKFSNFKIFKFSTQRFGNLHVVEKYRWKIAFRLTHIFGKSFGKLKTAYFEPLFWPPTLACVVMSSRALASNRAAGGPSDMSGKYKVTPTWDLCIQTGGRGKRKGWTKIGNITHIETIPGGGTSALGGQRVSVHTNTDKKSSGTSIHNSQWLSMPNLNQQDRVKNKQLMVWTDKDAKLAQTSLASKCYVLCIVCGVL